jgi:hypothetical protein
VAFDSQNQLIVWDTGNHMIQIFGASGDHLQSFGSSGKRIEQFKKIGCVSEDKEQQDRWFVTRKTTGSRSLRSKGDIKSFGSKGEVEGKLLYPSDCCINKEGDLIAVAETDQSSSPVVLMDLETSSDPLDLLEQMSASLIVQWKSQSTNRTGSWCQSIDGNRVQIFDRDGNFLKRIGSRGASGGHFSVSFKDLCVDHKDRVLSHR